MCDSGVDGWAGKCDLLAFMRGFPPVHLLFLVLMYGLVAVPLVQLTGRPVLREEAVLQQKDGAELALRLELRFTGKPAAIHLLVEGEEWLAAADGQGSPLELERSLPLNDDGLELQLEVEWPEQAEPGVVTLTVEPEGLEARSVTFWAEDGGVDEWIRFEWRERE